MKRRLALLLVVALLLGGMGRAVAQGGTEVNWWVIAGGGGTSAGGAVTINDTIGQPVIGLAQGGSVSLAAGYWFAGLGPTAVFLVSFAATPQGKGILVTWETAQESDTVGFNLYRAVKTNGNRIKINAEIIPSRVYPGSPSGAVYTYEDTTVKLPLSYYWLEVVDIHGHATLHGPVEARFQ